MTKLTVEPAVQDKSILTSSSGRVFKLGKPSRLAHLDFTEAMGSNGALNQLYIIEVSSLEYLRGIDDEIVTTPTDTLTLKALYNRLTEDELDDIKLWVYENILKPKADKESKLKNS